MTKKTYLVKNETEITKPAFPAIDAHNHLWGNWQVDKVVQTMNKVGITSYCDLTANVRIEFAGGGYRIGPGTISDFFENCSEQFPGRFYCFTMAGFAQPTGQPLFADDKQFVEGFIETLQEHVRLGAKGLKVLKELGLHYRDASGELIHVDDPRLAPIWEEAASLKIPVLIHQADPSGFFEPVSPENEHYESLKKYPSWSFADPRFPRKQELLKRRDRLIKQHPDTTFILPHFANHAENIPYVASLLDENPNVYIDFSARLDELGRQPYSSREFFIKYQDRIIFGTDMPANLESSVEMYRTYFRFLETYDEAFYPPDYDGTFERARWPICGIGLPNSVLEKIYSKNVLRIIPSLADHLTEISKKELKIMKNTKFTYSSLFFLLVTLYSCSTFSPDKNESFQSEWPEQTTRYWIGPEYWTNPLQDWQLNNGRLECLVSAENRNVHVLTHQLGDQSGDFDMQITVGMLGKPQQPGWAGFLIGAKGEFDDYRDNAIYGKGLKAGILTSGKLFIGKVDATDFNASEPALLLPMEGDGLTLKLQAVQENESYQVTLAAYDANSGELLGQIEKTTIPANDLVGNLALVSSFPNALIGTASGTENNGPSENIGSSKSNARSSFWFDAWQLSGDKIVAHEDQTFGPIMWSQYTLSKGVLKMTAQMAPVGKEDGSQVKLQIKGENNDWQTVQESLISSGSRAAIFRVGQWQDTADVAYRLAYEALGAGNKTQEHYWHGTVRKDPVDKNEVVAAAFTGNTDLGFPNNEVVKHVKAHKPDLLIFTGDQLYESVGGYGVEREPLEKATLDYLRKWYLYGWEYRDLLKDIPSLALPDDHDVYQGNIWGAGGKAADKEGSQDDQQDSGGYTMPAEWVNMVQQTQTGHFPDPFDPAPATQGISVYYCDLQLGGISFGVIEDRKWKTAPRTVLPAKLKVSDGWAEVSRTVDPKILDVPDAELLGKRQIEFIKDWASDWSNGVWMKTLVSQTIFSTVSTLPNEAVSDVVVPTLRITKKGEYPDGDIPTQDMDSNGWPQKGRNEALREIRKGYAFHIAGDQHLGSSLQYGIDDWGDAGYAICVPSISNLWPRRWFPEQGGKNRKPGAPKNTGDFLDGFGNKMTVLAVSNPYFTDLKPTNLYDRAAGYGIIKFNRESREIEFANWARQTDPTQPGAKPYDGWPITIQQEDNYGRKAAAYLPEIQVNGLNSPPVIQVIDESTEEIVYTLRAKENTFKPKVFKPGSYTIKVGEPGTNKMKTLANISDTKDEAKKMLVNFSIKSLYPLIYK